MLTLSWSMDSASLSQTCESNLRDDLEVLQTKRRINVGWRSSLGRQIVALLERASHAGLTVDYVLMNSWFTQEPLLRQLPGKVFP